MADQIVRERQRREITGIGRTTAWELEKKGLFPRRLELVGGRVGWRVSELQRWIESRRPVASE